LIVAVIADIWLRQEHILSRWMAAWRAHPKEKSA
jgi:hypothetical protein